MPQWVSVTETHDKPTAMIDSEDPARLLPAEMLIESALTLVADKGIVSFSMRVVAAAIGRSTTAIVHEFGNRDGLLAAMVKTALERDKRFHAEFLKNLSGLSPGAPSLTEIVAHYIESRVACDDAAVRVWPELLFNGERSSTLMAVLICWRQMREDFWQRLVPAGSAAMLAPLLADYTVTEGAYAIILHQQLDYRLLLRETIAHLLDGTFSRTSLAPTDKVRSWLEDTAPLAPPRSLDCPGTSRSHLLDVAADEILMHGATSLNHRRLTAKAGVSTAMIVYHFGSMEQFTVEAIWHALLTGLPAYLDDSVTVPGARQTVEEWPVILAQTLTPGRDASAGGFYIGYGRIVGQTCLLARHRADMIPLVRHLRLIEGSGIHHASQTNWPPSLALNRGKATALAIWIKGWAITVENTREDGLTSTRLDVVRRWIKQVGNIER